MSNEPLMSDDPLVIDSENFPALLGRSGAIQKVNNAAQRIASLDAPVLIYGESGTGKETLAKYLHHLAALPKDTFWFVNCSVLSMPIDLRQNEADNIDDPSTTSVLNFPLDGIGTVLLKSIEDLPAEAQLQLMALLEAAENRSKNSDGRHPNKLRFMATSQADLQDLVAKGSFREDLFYRLNAFFVEMPPLRQREEDIEVLARQFLEDATTEQHAAIVDFSEDTKRLINIHPWPGNIRELKNRVRRAVALCHSKFISPKDMGLERRAGYRSHLKSLSDIKAEAERNAVFSSLRRNRENIAAAARELKVSRVTLYRLMEKYAFTKSDSR